ncbi:MAG: NADH-quinone oxidoreductase subunit A [Nitrospinota bacterium]
MLASYFPIFVMLVLVTAFAIMNLMLSSLLGRRRRGTMKDSPYECGVEPIGNARIRFSVKFYIIAMLFILFDIEVVFLFPWAVVFRDLKVFGFVEMGVFIGILALGLLYVWRRGALDWT